MAEAIWDSFLTERDKEVFAVGGFGDGRAKPYPCPYPDAGSDCDRTRLAHAGRPSLSAGARG